MAGDRESPAASASSGPAPRDDAAPTQRWHTRTSLHCPACGYDVTQTIADAFERCPECGNGVSPEICTTKVRTIPALARAGLAIFWMSPLLTTPIVVGIIEAYFGTGAPAGTVLAVYGTNLLAIYLTWWRVERWAQPNDAAGRAVWRTAVIFFIHLGSIFVVAMTVGLLSGAI